MCSIAEQHYEMQLNTGTKAAYILFSVTSDCFISTVPLAPRMPFTVENKIIHPEEQKNKL